MKKSNKIIVVKLPIDSPQQQEIKALKRQNRELKKHLKDLTILVSNYLKNLDVVMKEPSTVERGRKIANLANSLDFFNDSARYFGLGVDFRKDKKK